MKLEITSSRYGFVSQALHWLTVALVIFLLVSGKFGDVEADEPGSALFIWHGSLGLLVLLLVAARIVWGFIHRAPDLPNTMTRIARISARTMHGCLYALLVALPLSGWLAASAHGASVSFFGVVSIPALQLHGTAKLPSPAERETNRAMPASEKGDEFFEEIHELLGNVLLILASLHLLIALKHHYFDRDDVLKRMLPW